MIVLKSQVFTNGAKDLVNFINKNNIKKEDILAITEEANWNYTLFFYGNSETEEITRGFWG